MKSLLLASVAALGLASAAPAFAQVETYTLDKPHTQIIFFVDHLGFSKSEGEFLDYNGTISFDRANPAASKVDVTIKTDSLDMGDATWDDHMKDEKFFNVKKFPDMTFKSTKIDVTGDKTAKITGDLTLLGVTRPVTLDTVFNNAGKHPMSGKNVAGFSATGKIKRSDFGMTYALPMVGDEAELRIEVEAVQADAATDTPAKQ